MGTFLNSVIRQLGRDSGKVISNSLFGDAHSTPVRMTRSKTAPERNSSPERKKRIQSQFDKALNFDRSATPKTLVRKIQALSVLLEEETHEFLSDDYFSSAEAGKAFEMISTFSNKAASVTKQLEFDEEANVKELKQIEEVVVKTNEDFLKLLERAAQVCDDMVPKLQEKSKEVSQFNALRWIMLHTIYMRGYAKTGETKMLNTILANVLLFGTQPIMLVVGLITAPFEYNRLKKDGNVYIKAIEIEKQKAAEYRKLIENNSMH